MLEIFADGSLSDWPRGSINLDVPMVLLNPDDPNSSRTRPSNIAQACDLLPEMQCYRVLRLVEDHIVTHGLFEALDPLFFTVSELDEHAFPKAVFVRHFSEALAALRVASSEPDSPKPTP